MPDNEVQQKNDFLVCPVCHGVGWQGDSHCPECAGAGVALLLGGRVFYWGEELDSVNNAFNKFARILRMIFNLLLGLLSLAGLGYFFYQGYQSQFQNIVSVSYWLTTGGEKAILFASLLLLAFLYYRLDRDINGGREVLAAIKKESFPSVAALTWTEVKALPQSRQIEISGSFKEIARTAVLKSWELAKSLEHGAVERLHLLSVLPQFDKSATILARLGVNFQTLNQKLGKFLGKVTGAHQSEPLLSREIRETLLLAYLESYRSHRARVDLTELVLALAKPEQITIDHEIDYVEEILIDLDLNYHKFNNVIAWIRIQDELRENLANFRSKARYKPKSGMDRAMTGVATPILNAFAEDLTLKAKYGQLFPCIGRKTEIERIFRIMEGSRQGVLLIGQPGVGKTSIIEGLAQRMVEESVPEVLQDKRLLLLSVPKLLAGTDASGAEERLLLVADEVMRSRNIILAVEDIHTLVGITAGGETSLDMSEVFAQIMNKHLFNVIATTNQTAYAKAIENQSLGGAFQLVKVEELELNDAIWVLEAKSGPIEYSNNVYFSYDAIEKSAVMSSRYIHEKYLPEKAIELLEQAAITVKQTRGEGQVVKGEDIAVAVSALTKIPVTEVGAKESDKLLHLEENLHERMVGQNEAVQMVAASLRRARADLREGKRPIASLMFLGPTGVGKTELAKTVSEVYFGNEGNMIRIDMSEYQDKASLNRLIGAGDNAGNLTEAVRNKPFSLVLFDEVEKAHPDILNLFLQLMDDGRLTDSAGRVIDFTNTIVILTSNAGAQYVQDALAQNTPIEQIKEHLINEELRQNFRPEFLNRLDGLVVFKPLTLSEVIQIAHLIVNKISKQLEAKGITFSATDEAVAELAEKGFDPKFGARPLRRAVQERIDDVLAKYLLSGQIKRRDKVVMEVGGQLRIEKASEL